MEILLWLGLIVFLLGGLGLLIAAFKTSLLWGLAVLVLPPAAILYLLLNWHDAKGAFKLQVAGFLIMLAVSHFQGQDLGWHTVTNAVAGFSITGDSVKTGRSSTQSAGSGLQKALGGSTPAANSFRCDGRTHCSQMRSCEEAKFFLRNCPGTKMDGDGDGIPCERQWCRG